MVLLCHSSYCGYLESLDTDNETTAEFRGRSLLDLSPQLQISLIWKFFHGLPILVWDTVAKALCTQPAVRVVSFCAVLKRIYVYRCVCVIYIYMWLGRQGVDLYHTYMYGTYVGMIYTYRYGMCVLCVLSTYRCGILGWKSDLRGTLSPIES